MELFFIRGFTGVPGDEAYIEAESEKQARDALAARLELGGLTPDCLPRERWEVTQMHRPVCLLIWRN